MFKGSCLCRSIQYSIDTDLKYIINCHCRFCSKAHGAPYTTLHVMPYSGLKIMQGEELLTGFPVEAIQAVRYFCSRCGTRLYNHIPAAGKISLMVATLDSDAEVRPIANANVGSKRSWDRVDDELPRFSAWPSPAELQKLLAR
jgi:hypothetical protein